jgi:hypothetical protein
MMMVSVLPDIFEKFQTDMHPQKRGVKKDAASLVSGEPYQCIPCVTGEWCPGPCFQPAAVWIAEFPVGRKRAIDRSVFCSGFLP